MNAKDQAALDAAIAQLTTEFTAAMTAALQPLVLEINALQQRSHNFAERVTHHNKAYRAEIISLREQVAKLTPKRELAPDRITSAAWDEALGALQKETGVNFHSPSVVRGRAAQIAASRTAKPAAVDEFADMEDVSL